MTAERLSWPSPFDAMIDTIKSHRGKRIAILVTGDPLWYSVGARITKAIPASEIRFHPQLSAFQWAACRMGWSLADSEQITIHGRAASQIVPHLAPGVKLLVLTKDRTSPTTVASLLCDHGFGASSITALAALGGADEQRLDGIAESWNHTVPDFHILAVECRSTAQTRWLSRAGGLPDEAFVHDGQMTKSAVRSMTLPRLMPYPDAVLWDVGAGCGSISIEWIRAARGAHAIAIEPNDKRRAMIVQNARALGTEKIAIVDGEAPQALTGLQTPDAIFIGGGLTKEGVFEQCWQALRSGGRLVANAVTLESEKIMIERQAELGGDLARLSVDQASPVGPFRGWKPSMPMTQWSVWKP